MLAIAKFGGSSLSCAANWKRVREIVTGDIARRAFVADGEIAARDFAPELPARHTVS